ncbi:MAG: hypothetical protein A2079_03610 [Geobacteraceae bacterium GWC2_48_7]|nr:MAG: hypothetical protein A2079_03610 [Geobacteraceae bacterium GWC2_48_7]
MKNRYAIAIALLVSGTFALSGLAFAHGTEKHDKAATTDAQMKKLHAMMPMFSIASAKLEIAIEKGDAVTVEREAGKILKAMPDLKSTKPHKNVNQRKQYIDLANDLEAAVNSTVFLAQKGDFPETKAVFKKVEDVCAACHAQVL